MEIKKRTGRSVNFNPNKVTLRLRNQSNDLKVDADALSIKVIGQIAPDMTTRDLDNLCIETASAKVPDHPDYSVLAARVFVTSLRKYTSDTFSGAVEELNYEEPVVSQEYVEFVKANSAVLDEMIVQDRDFNHDIFGLKTLEKSYLLRHEVTKDEKGEEVPGAIIERPQYMWLRVAIQVTKFKLDEVKETYDTMSQKYGTHATPTLFNSGTKLSQLSSCFLLANKGDSVDGLFDTMKDVAHISKLAGGIGLHIHDVRAAGSLIKGTNGKSDGLLPMMKTYNEIARWINQGGKRKGSFAMYVEPWHADIFQFLDLRKNTGKEEMRARDLFYALWIPDYFMKMVEEDGDWTLFCPNELKKNNIVLQDTIEDKFVEAYKEGVEKGLGRKTIKARELWHKIVEAQIETGNPYVAYKDAVNRASNQKNLGVIKSSNLCIEINEYSDDKEQAVCNLASIALAMFVEDGVFNFDKFGQKVRLFTKNLNNVIDVNYYPTVETERSNSRHRPIGLGVQGLADTFALIGIAFDSPEAAKLNKDIFEVMYFNSLWESNRIAQEDGAYSSFKGSPASKGILQFDMYAEGDWNYEGSYVGGNEWKALKASIQNHGLRNSLNIALMPTASTSQILGFNECFEPFNSNLSTRGTLAGTFVVSNKYLVKDLEEIGLWHERMKNKLMAENGSVQNIPEIPTYLKERYKTVYEISMKTIMNMAADRQRFVCQAQSMNLFVKEASVAVLSSIHMYGWKLGLKTGMYYLRTKPAVDAIKFTVDKQEEEVPQDEFKAMIERARVGEGDDDCEMCSG
tara:strand:- start:31540 stop:33924 length:2385 start_codon:yes stop_codon:yes gene_type:complete